MKALIMAAALAASLTGIAAAEASAQPGWHDNRDHHDNRGRAWHDNRHHAGNWNNHRAHGWRNSRCTWVWQHHHRVRRC